MTAATLLIVEDDGILAADLEIILTGLGYRILGPAATGEEALSLLQGQSADLVLMDIELAGELNGIETAQLLGRGHDIPVVFLTGFSQDPLLDQAKAVAPYGYLIKPVSERELAATVAMSLHRHGLDRQLKKSRRALEESEQRHRHYLQNTPYGVFAVNGQGRYLQVNPSACRITGYSENELLTMGVEDVFPEADKEAGRHHFQKVVDEGRAEGELPFRTKGGERRWWSITSVKAANDRYLGFCNDVTERRKAEESLRESEVNFRSFFASMTDMCVVADLDGRILVTNTALSHTLGYSTGELSTMRVIDLYPPDRRKEAAAVFTAIIEKQTTDCRLPLLTASGESVPAVSRVWLGSWNGKGCIYATCRNLSKEQEAEQRFEGLFRRNPALMALNNTKDRRFVDVNDSWLAKIGYTRNDVIGRTAGELALFPFPEQYEAAARRLKEEGRISDFELQVRCRDGSFLHGIFSGEMIRSQGRIYVLTVMIDITERKRAEENIRQRELFLRSVVETTAEGFWVIDAGGRVSEVNEAYCHMSGFSKEEIIGRHINDIDAQETPAQTAERIQRIIAGGKELFETRHHRQDGGSFPVEVSVIFLPEQGGQFVCFCRDLSEKKRMEEERNRLQGQLVHAQKMESIGTLAGGIAHDFNNILGAVIGYAEMAREDSPPRSAAVQSLDRVLEAGKRAASLVKQILAFSRQQDSKRFPLIPGPIIKEVVKLLRPMLPSTIAIVHRIDSTRSVLADPTQLHQVLMNLATNAFHAMEQTGGELAITINDVEYGAADLTVHPGIIPGSFVLLSVADTGPGISPEIKSRIFDPYFTTKEVGKGTGMGLAIVDGIVRGSGGFISCESEPGKGTVFTLALPAFEGEDADKGEEAGPVTNGAGRILLVDDEELLVNMVRSMLERLGYQVTAHTSSSAALATFNKAPHSFDAVVTDQTMPAMTGLDLARRMLRIRPELPVILCTGYSNLVDEAQAKASGIKGFAMKPLTQKSIAALLTEVMK